MMWITPSPVATVTVSSEPCRPPTFSSPVSKSVHTILATGTTWCFTVSAKSSRTRSSSAVTPSASKAVVRAAKALALFSPDQVHSEEVDKDQAIKL